MNDLTLRALKLSKGLALTATHLEKVAGSTSPEAAREAFTQWELRSKASVKFERAQEMLFTREALEQATAEPIAHYHASLFPPGVPVIDLTCGIGGDMIALGLRGPSIGFELDSFRAECAVHNLEVNGAYGEVRCEDGMAWLESASDAFIFADPSRRRGGKRTLDMGEFEPDPHEIARNALRQSLVVIKLSPMLADAHLEALGSRLEFLSFGNECREALVVAGKEASPGRVAVRIESGAVLAAGTAPQIVGRPHAYLFDADAAAVRAHALGALADQHGLLSLGDSPGYLTGLTRVKSEWLQCFGVLDELSADLKKLKTRLRELDSKTPILKQRGAGLDLIKLRKDLRLEGARSLSVAFYKLNSRVRCLILEPL